MKYSTLLFDVDDTLLDFKKSEKTAIKKSFCDFEIDCKDENVELYSKTNIKYWKMYESGIIKKDEIYVGRFKEFLKIINNHTVDAFALSENYFNNLVNQFFKVEGAEEILHYLSKRYDIYFVTNGSKAVQHSRLNGSGIIKYATDVFISEAVGFGKPDKKYFDYVFDNIKEKDKSKVIIIGDSMSSDILGGINAGIDTCFVNFNNEKQVYETTYTVKNLYELRKIF